MLAAATAAQSTEPADSAEGLHKWIAEKHADWTPAQRERAVAAVYGSSSGTMPGKVEPPPITAAYAQQGKGGGRGGGSGGRGGVLPGSATPPPPGTAGAHRQEPPPGGTPWRKCAPPANGLGKPSGMPGGDWTAEQWAVGCSIDFDKIDALAPTAAGVATARARPDSAAMNTTRMGRPRSEGGPGSKWPADACTFCRFRPLAPAGTKPEDAWKFGTGDGAHNPYPCQPAKRWLAEGGDLNLEPQYAEHLRGCLRVQQPRQ